jgi:RNA polymerase sigma factor (sigma-70 family)
MTPWPMPETEKLLVEISSSIRAIMARRFPSLTISEREDVEQDVRLKLWKIWTSGKKIDRLESYLWKVVYTTALDLLEGKRNEIPLEAACGPGRPAGEPAVKIDWEDADARLDLNRRLEALPQNRRLVVKLHLAGMDLAETAAHLGWSRAKVRHLFYRGLDDLKRMIGKEKSGNENKSEGEDDGRRQKLLSAKRRVREVFSK